MNPPARPVGSAADTGRVGATGRTSKTGNAPTPGHQGQAILNGTASPQMPEHTFHQPVPIVARIVWADDGEEHVETVALGWTGRRRVRADESTRDIQLRAVWLDASDVKRR